MTEQQLLDLLQGHLNTIAKIKGHDETTAIAYQLGFVQGLLVKEMYRDSLVLERVVRSLRENGKKS